MKIEMGESLLMSWLKHAKCCKITQLNWKPSSNWEVYTENEEELKKLFANVIDIYPDVIKKNTFDQFLSQAELDVLGVDIDSKYYAIDVAFHEAGLNYGSTEETINRITKKLIRSAFVLNYQFNTRKGEIIFATPKINKVLIEPLEERLQAIKDLMINYNFEFRLIANTDFSEKILNPIIEMSTNIADTSELFMRAFQLYNMSNKTVKENTNKPRTKLVTNYSEFSIANVVREKLSYLFDNNLLSDTEIENLKDKDYCKRILNIDYPLLIDKNEDGKDTNGKSRYLVKPIFANKYRATNYWFERHRQPFEAWYKSITEN